MTVLTNVTSVAWVMVKAVNGLAGSIPLPVPTGPAMIMLLPTPLAESVKLSGVASSKPFNAWELVLPS